MVEFAPGLRIDWNRKRIELDARVVLREGPLELFACSPGTREHESIIAVAARPLHIFQVLGLLGLEPGHPARYYLEDGRIEPAKGALLSLQVRLPGQTAEPIETWMSEIRSKSPMHSADWVFAGARFDGEHFGADMEGTVVTVVDFSTSLIALAESHTSDDSFLWLEARREAIPLHGTPCTILIEAAEQTRLSLDVSADGKLRHEDRALSSEELARLLGERRLQERLSCVILRVPAEASPDPVQSIVSSVVKAGVRLESIRVVQTGEDEIRRISEVGF